MIKHRSVGFLRTFLMEAISPRQLRLALQSENRLRKAVQLKRSTDDAEKANVSMRIIVTLNIRLSFHSSKKKLIKIEFDRATSFSKTDCAVPEESHHEHVLASQGRILERANNNTETECKCLASISTAYTDKR